MKLEGAFVVGRDFPVIEDGREGDEVRDCHLYALGAYTPRLFRRRRLRRFAELARRVHFVRTAWRWAR